MLTEDSRAKTQVCRPSYRSTTKSSMSDSHILSLTHTVPWQCMLKKHVKDVKLGRRHMLDGRGNLLKLVGAGGAVRGNNVEDNTAYNILAFSGPTLDPVFSD